MCYNVFMFDIDKYNLDTDIWTISNQTWLSSIQIALGGGTDM